MDELLGVAKAFGDASRVRIVMALRNRELCLCQLIDLLELAPSTVSKHMDVLYRAGLVRRRKEGRWHFYRLAGEEAAEPVREGLRWAMRTLRGDPTIASDVRRLQIVAAKDLEEVAACYRG